ncbi:MAG: penicillin-binding protein 1C [Desulfobacterales bacterium]|nr:penicillin-binding protein 1C [Desulfobacterales bacterium]
MGCLRNYWQLNACLIAIGLPVAFVLGVLLVSIPQKKIWPAESYRFYDANGEMLAVLLSDDDFFRMKIPLEKISPLFIDTLLIKEDQYFYDHPGVNPLSILRAMGTNFQQGRIVSGASTLTMQLARMLDRRDRTYFNKAVEVFRAIKLERNFSKREILEHYLAIAPYGGNIEGVEAAAYAYFGKSAEYLSPAEIALLIALPRAPNALRPDRHPERARQTRDQVLQVMRKRKLIDEQQYLLSLQEPLPTSRQSFPNHIPHTAWSLKARYPQNYVHQLTIDRNLQSRTHTLLKQHVLSLAEQGITNGAVVVMETRTREVKALVGSRDYFDQASLGANNGASSFRSPGSTLKPFLYALAVDSGMVSEKTVLYDIPVNYGGYSPQNYSKEFRGLVTMRDALAESLNVVAVTLSEKIGYQKLHRFLKQAKITSLKNDADYYGLPLVLGGVEMSLLELTNLYTVLANEGSFKPYRLNGETEGDGISERQLISPEASWIITDILTDVERPDFPSSWEFSSSRPTIAWKTGTSYAHQDAWSVGYTPEYTIGVWIGNFDATPAQGLSGSSVAAPLLFDVFQAVALDPNRWFDKPAMVQKRKVCAECGLPGNRFCKTEIEEYFVPTVVGPVTSKRCEVSQKIVIDRRTGRQATSETPTTEKLQKIFKVWPSEMAMFLLEHGVPVRKVPAYDINNMAGQKYYPPIIQSPVKNTQYIKRPDQLEDHEQAIKLRVATTNRVRQVSWFLNEKHIATVDPGEPVYINPPVGEYIIKVVDEVGGEDHVPLSVSALYH